MGSSAAATCISAWVSTPPVMTRASSTMVNAIPFLWLKGWHAPAGRRTCEPRPLAQDGQIGTAPPVGAITWDPAGESLAGQPDRASADSEVRPGPRPPTLRPHHHKTTQAGPEALSPSSLPNRDGQLPWSSCQLPRPEQPITGFICRRSGRCRYAACLAFKRAQAAKWQLPGGRGKSGYSSQHLSNSGRPIWTGAVLWMALNVRRERRRGSGSGPGVQRVVLLQDGEDPRNRALRRPGLPALR